METNYILNFLSTGVGGGVARRKQEPGGLLERSMALACTGSCCLGVKEALPGRQVGGGSPSSNVSLLKPVPMQQAGSGLHMGAGL